MTFCLPVLAVLPLLCLLGTSGFTLDALLLSAVALLSTHLLHLLPARFALGSLLLATILLLHPPSLSLLRLTLLGLLPAGVHLVHPLLAASVVLLTLLVASFVLLTHLLHHLLTLLSAVGTGLLLRSLPFSSASASPILPLRWAGLTRLSAAAVTAFLALSLPLLTLRTATPVTAPAALGRRAAAITSTVSAAAAAAFALAERIGLRSD